MKVGPARIRAILAAMPGRDPKRHATVLFFGQTGTEKFSQAEDPRERSTVDRALLGQVASVTGPEGVSPDDRWRAFSFEPYLMPGTTLDVFLRSDRGERSMLWREACHRLAEEINNEGETDTIGVFLHGYYWHEGELFQHIDLSALRSLKPTLVVTLIDDVFDVHTRILNREKAHGRDASKISLPQLLTWRSVEISIGDIIAQNLFEDRVLPHIVLSVKHSALTLYRLLFERSSTPVYASFPISRAREPRAGISPQDRRTFVNEVDNFRHALIDAGYPLLDPLTIDEIRFPLGADDYPRWELDNDPSSSYAPMVPAEPELHKRTLKEIGDPAIRAVFTTETMEQVTPRDLRMIDASWAVAAYRPQAFDGTHSGGTFEELRYACDHGRAALAINLAEQDGEYRNYPVGSGILSGKKDPIVHASLEGGLQYLAGVQRARSKEFGPGKEPEIWTEDAGHRLERRLRKRRPQT